MGAIMWSSWFVYQEYIRTDSLIFNLEYNLPSTEFRENSIIPSIRH